jgi:hypothetical protein
MSPKSTKREVEPLGLRVRPWCKATDTSPATAYKMMADGRLPYVVIGGRRFIPNSVIQRLLEPAPANRR